MGMIERGHTGDSVLGTKTLKLVSRPPKALLLAANFLSEPPNAAFDDFSSGLEAIAANSARRTPAGASLDHFSSGSDANPVSSARRTPAGASVASPRIGRRAMSRLTPVAQGARVAIDWTSVLDRKQDSQAQALGRMNCRAELAPRASTRSLLLRT